MRQRKSFALATVALVALVCGVVFPTALKAQSEPKLEKLRAAAGRIHIAERVPVASKLVWHKDLEQSLEMARRANKMVLVDVYTDWCGWCHRLDRDTYSNPDVITFVNNQFVCLKLDAEDGGKGARFAQKHKVKGYPCTMVLDASGKRLGVFYGYRPAQQFPDAVRQALEKSGSVG